MATGQFTRHAHDSEGLSRRNLLTISAGAVVAPAAALAQGGTTTPIVALYRKYVAMRAEMAAAFDADAMSDDEYSEAFFAASDRIEAEMMDLPCTCAADFAAKMLVSHCDGDFSCLPKHDTIWAEARQLVGAA